MSIENVMRFWEWFDETRDDRPIRQIEKRAGCPRGRIGNAYSHKREPTILVCKSIAKGLGIRLEEVFNQIGIINPNPPETASRKELDYLWTKLTTEDQDIILDVVRSIAIRRKPADAHTRDHQTTC